MTRFDSADDAERTIAYFIADVLHKVRGETPSPLVAPQNVQAAAVFCNVVAPCPSEEFWKSDRLYAIAVHLADSIDHDAEGAPLAGTLRAWAAGVERRRR